MPVIKEEFSGILIERKLPESSQVSRYVTAPKGAKTIDLRSKDGAIGDRSERYFMNAKVTITIEYDESQEYGTKDHG